MHEGVEMKIVTVFSLIVVIIACMVACALGAASTSQSTLSAKDGNHTPAASTLASTEATIDVPAPITSPGMTLGAMPPGGRNNVYSLELSLISAKQIYQPGEEIRMELVLTNASNGPVEPVILSSLPPAVSLVKAGSFSSPAMPPGVVGPSSETGLMSAAKTFPAGTSEKTLAKGEKLIYYLAWDLKASNGNQVSPGWYNYESMCWYRLESSKDNVVSGMGNRAFLIQYQQVAMTKTIEVNQSRTITGLPIRTLNGETKLVDVVVTLERVELNEMGATFYAKMTSPNNPVSGYNNFEWLSRIPLSAQYVVDGVIKEARAPNSKFLDTGIEFGWGASADASSYLDPVPADAKELSLIIPEIRPDWEGPWEFKIPLE